MVVLKENLEVVAAPTPLYSISLPSYYSSLVRESGVSPTNQIVAVALLTN